MEFDRVSLCDGSLRGFSIPLKIPWTPCDGVRFSLGVLCYRPVSYVAEKDRVYIDGFR